MEEKENMIRREKCLVDQKDEMLERNEGLIICFSILLVVYEREMEECLDLECTAMEENRKRKKEIYYWI